tara:strand:- start:37 stop:999 length:963 start_codon:yes stop_codon:yes gene_type:complete
MACTKNTFPVNLINTTNACDITCNLSFDYNNSANFKVSNNNGSYISIEYEQSSNPNLTFSSTKYTASEIRLYIPSLHTYNGKMADAEILINHGGNNNKHLIISIPIINKDYISNSGITLARIIDDMKSSRLNDFTEPLHITNYSLNLNDIVPEKPFFYYEGCSNNPNLFTNTNVKIIAFNNSFDTKSSGAIYVDNKFISNLKALLTNPNNISTVQISKNELFYNMNGPENSKKENIYIDCQPTNEQGEVFAPINKSNTDSTFFENLSKIGGNEKEMTIIKGLLGLFIMFIILWVAKVLMELILSKFSKRGQSGGYIIDSE